MGADSAATVSASGHADDRSGQAILKRRRPPSTGGRGRPRARGGASWPVDARPSTSSSSGTAGTSTSSATASSATTRTRPTWRRTSSSARSRARASFKGDVVARHVALSRRRECVPEPRRRRRRRSTEPIDGALARGHARRGSGWTEVAARRARRGACGARSRKLPPKQRATLMLRVYQELLARGNRRVLGSSVGAVKANFFHALGNLRRLLQTVMTHHLHPKNSLKPSTATLAPTPATHLDGCDACRARARPTARRRCGACVGVDVPEPSPLFWDHFSARVRQAVAARAAPRALAARCAPSARWQIAAVAAGAHVPAGRDGAGAGASAPADGAGGAPTATVGRALAPARRCSTMAPGESGGRRGRWSPGLCVGESMDWRNRRPALRGDSPCIGS